MSPCFPLCVCVLYCYPPHLPWKYFLKLSSIPVFLPMRILVHIKGLTRTLSYLLIYCHTHTHTRTHTRSFFSVFYCLFINYFADVVDSFKNKFLLLVCNFPLFYIHTMWHFHAFPHIGLHVLPFDVYLWYMLCMIFSDGQSFVTNLFIFISKTKMVYLIQTHTIHAHQTLFAIKSSHDS